VNYVGIDWAYGRAAFCSMNETGSIEAEGTIPASEDGLARLVLKVGSEVKACVEMMSGAVWVRDQLAMAGWEVQVAHARKVRDVAPLACKTDKVDARVLAELTRRDLVPELWVPPPADRALREHLRRRMHLSEVYEKLYGKRSGTVSAPLPVEPPPKADPDNPHAHTPSADPRPRTPRRSRARDSHR
jgi:Transposase